MAHIPTQALVLRRTDFSETSLVLALLTEASGRQSVLVKGAKRPKSPFFGALDLYSLNHVVFLERRSSDLALLTEAGLIESFTGMRRHLTNAYAAHAVAELLLGLLHDHEPVTDILQLTCRTFANLATAKPEQAHLHLARFQIQLLKALGTELVLDRCVLCEKPLPATAERTAVSVTSGGSVCQHCSPRAHEVIQVSPGTISVLAALAGPATNMVARMRLTGRIRGELRALMTRAYTHLLGRVPKMTRFLHGEPIA